jgi:E3 ubiquitin-protein ligase HERC4
VENWFALQDKDYLLPIINSYKKAVVHILKLRSKSSNPNEFEQDLGLALCFLRILNRINVNNHCIVGYEDFYIAEVSDFIELPDAYIRWILAKSRGLSSNDFHICNFPFVFDAGAKTVLLQTDQAFQMHNAAQQAISEATFRY